MMKTIHAIYENGVFRPTEPVDLPDRTAVEFEPRVPGPGGADERGTSEDLRDPGRALRNG